MTAIGKSSTVSLLNSQAMGISPELTSNFLKKVEECDCGNFLGRVETLLDGPYAIIAAKIFSNVGHEEPDDYSERAQPYESCSPSLEIELSSINRVSQMIDNIKSFIDKILLHIELWLLNPQKEVEKISEELARLEQAFRLLEGLRGNAEKLKRHLGSEEKSDRDLVIISKVIIMSYLNALTLIAKEGTNIASCSLYNKEVWERLKKDKEIYQGQRRVEKELLQKRESDKQGSLQKLNNPKSSIEGRRLILENYKKCIISFRDDELPKLEKDLLEKIPPLLAAIKTNNGDDEEMLNKIIDLVAPHT